MKVIKVLETIISGAAKSIFLAGPTHRIKSDLITVTNEGKDIPHSWRDDAIDLLENSKFDGVVYSPEWVDNEKPSGWTYDKQVQWEVEALNAADIILFWIPRDMDKLPALTTNIEFGEWMHSGKIIVGAPNGAVKMDYIKSRCSQNLDSIPFCSTLQECISGALEMVEEKAVLSGNTWFTSDTHWGQERTLALSRRPFRNVEHMDQEMVRRWNSVVSDDDTIYHLGDFGDAETAARILSQLNGAKIYLIPGNYENEEVLKALSTDPRLEVLPQGQIISLDGVKVRLVHEPENMAGNMDFHLFGHVHQLQMIKTRAFNVGADCHNYTPIDKSTVLFYYNAITKHYDANVFSDFVEG